jgi:CBS-domain-containing membrane protein
MNTKAFVLLVALVAAICFTGCQTVDITKTGKGFHAPTNPNDVEILMTRPDRAYEELGTINATGFLASETAKMHNALRAKAAPLGANAVIVTGSGMLPGGLAGPQQWITGVAVSWK